MNDIDIETVSTYLEQYLDTLMGYLPSIITAIIIYLVGSWAIRMVVKVIGNIFVKRGIDITLKRFLLDVITWTLRILLFVVVISQLGVQTSSLVALIGAAGLAVGLALQGSLANFAGGVLIMLFKPFKLGDFISAQGEDGTIKEIGIFYTKMTTVNNQLVILPNGKLSNDNIVNYTVEGKRRNVMTFAISYDSDIKKAKETLLQVMNEQENVLKDPAPVVFVAELADSSVKLSARFWASNEHFWDCHFYTMEEAKTRLKAAGIVIPFPQRDVHHYNLDKVADKITAKQN
ncbi:MAG TPA: mechanosensitive ion channel domain-containing protein [Flavobacteriaceae bacterium]|nr:mechanosensitive ion channel domain-containing protein [Flavobacteriaceae bacterium]